MLQTVIKDGLEVLCRRIKRAVVGDDTGPASAFAKFEGLEPRLQFAAGAVEPPVPADADAPTDLLPDLIPWASKKHGFVYGWRLDRSDRPGKVLLRLTSAMANIGEGAMELRGGPPADGGGQEVYQRVYTSDGKSRDRLAGVFRYHAAHNHTHFDNFAAYRLRHMTEDDGVGRTVKAGNKVSFCLTDSDSYDLKLPNAPRNGRYYACGARRQGISAEWADIYDETLPDQWINVSDVKPGKYWLEVVVDPKNRVLEKNERNNVVRIPITLRHATAPRNDHFTQATVLKGAQATSRGSNENATRQEDEPRHAQGTGGASVWWSWTAPASGVVSINTRWSEVDTLLAVYTGKSLHNLKLVASNDDARGEVTSRLSFVAKKGTTYRIAVDGYRGASGDIRLGLKQDA